MDTKINKKHFIRDTAGQAMTEYIMTVIFMVVLSIPVIKWMPKVFINVFEKIVTYYSLHMDTLSTRVQNLFY